MMTHDELLKQIHDKWHSNYERQDVFYIALRAVVELHKPLGDAKPYDKDFKCCGCKYNPCPTIQAIEKELQ